MYADYIQGEKKILMNLEIYQQLRCTWMPNSNRIILPNILKYWWKLCTGWIITYTRGSPCCMCRHKCKYCQCKRWNIRLVRFSFNKCIFAKRLLQATRSKWQAMRLQQLQSAGFTLWASDVCITAFLWRQSTQHEGVMPIAPVWAAMMVSCT